MAFVNSLLLGAGTLADNTAQVKNLTARFLVANIRADLSHDAGAIVSHDMNAVLIQCQRFGAFVVVRRIVVSAIADFDVDRIYGDAFDLYHELATSRLGWFRELLWFQILDRAILRVSDCVHDEV